jgi:cell division protein FtsZ
VAYGPIALFPLALEEIVDERSSSRLQVAVVGVGGAGTNLLGQAITTGLSPRYCVAVNTDRNRLSQSPAQNKVLLKESEGTCNGHVVENSNTMQTLAHRVAPFTRESDVTILLAGLGGLTGTVAAPAIAQLNRSQVRPVVSVVALPFIHEREKRFVALRGLKRMVEACDCTVVVDNAVQSKRMSRSDRTADETACLSVKGLLEMVGGEGVDLSHAILRILGLGKVASACIAPVSSADNIQSAVMDALRTPSASLPLSQSKGAVLLYRGSERLSTGQTALAYEAVVSLVGHSVEFANVNVRSDTDPLILILLSGYSYGNCLGAFVDLIEDLYDMEYGLESASSVIGLPSRLYQMESY